MRLKVGPAVSGDDFFDRPREIQKIIRALDSDCHILISSPRRVGKTSILYRLADNPHHNKHFIYVITQSIRTENEFYQRLYWAVVESDSLTGTATRLSHKTQDLLKQAIDKVESVKGVTLNKGRVKDYKKAFLQTLQSLRLEGMKLVIMIDEFTQTVENIMKKEGEDGAVHFLQSIREIRHDEIIKNNVLFLFTGSVGVENVAARLGVVDLIADLSSVKVNPLRDSEAVDLVTTLLENLGFKMSEALIRYMLSKIEWLIPFHIQMLLQEINNVRLEDGHQEITEAVIKTAFTNMLKHRNHFEHWQTRLRKTFKKMEYRFAEEVLCEMARKSTLSSGEILNLAVKQGVEDDYKNIIRVLIHDGYINNNDDPGVYRFNSPILKTWWYENVAN
jgi:hypothetical protein